MKQGFHIPGSKGLVCRIRTYAKSENPNISCPSLRIGDLKTPLLRIYPIHIPQRKIRKALSFPLISKLLHFLMARHTTFSQL